MTLASARSVSSSTLMTPSWGSTTYSAQPPMPTPRNTGAPSRDSGLVPSGRALRNSADEYSAHSVGWDRVQK